MQPKSLSSRPSYPHNTSFITNNLCRNHMSVELSWDGKYTADGKKSSPLRIALPFQTCRDGERERAGARADADVQCWS